MDKIALLSEILKQNPADAFTRYGLAMAHASEGNHEQALAEYATILEHTPDYVPAHQMSAQLLLKLSRTEEARASLSAGLAAANRTGNAHAHAEMQGMLRRARSLASTRKPRPCPSYPASVPAPPIAPTQSFRQTHTHLLR